MLGGYNKMLQISKELDKKATPNTTPTGGDKEEDTLKKVIIKGIESGDIKNVTVEQIQKMEYLALLRLLRSGNILGSEVQEEQKPIMPAEKKLTEIQEPTARDVIAEEIKSTVMALASNLNPQKHKALLELATLLAGFAHTRGSFGFSQHYNNNVLPFLEEQAQSQSFGLLTTKILEAAKKYCTKISGSIINRDD